MDKKVCEYCGRTETKNNKVFKIETEDGYENVCRDCLYDMEVECESEMAGY